jgi:cell division protease FtsH
MSKQIPSSPGPMPRPPALLGVPWNLLVPVMALVLLVWAWRSGVDDDARPTVDYSVFYAWVEAGKVKLVELAEPELDGELNGPEQLGARTVQRFRTRLPEADTALLPLLHQKKVEIRVSDAPRPFWADLLLALLPWLVLVAVWSWASRSARATFAGGPWANMSKSKGRRFEKSSTISVKFDEVAGLASAKRDLQEVVLFLKQPERFRRLGGKVPRGVLLVGPPGTGKTLLARAVAGESGVPFFSISASEFIEMFVGVGAARVRDLFEEAKKSAPAIIFIDELDAVGRARGAGLGGGHDEREQTLNQLLSELDGFDRNDLTVVLAATNRPDVLDPALLRPGRFDRRVVVDRPEREARRAILDVHVKHKPLAADVELDRVARNTPGFSGADLANLVNEAALHATRRGADALAAVDFAEAYDKIVLGDPREAKLTPDESRRVAVHEAGHVVVAQYSPEAELPQRVTIIPRGMTLGATQQAPAEDRHIATEPQLRSRLRVLLGGHAAERLVFGSISTGAENDLREATQLAAKMVAHYGMSRMLGPAYYEHDVEHPFLGRRMATEGGTSDATAHVIETEATHMLGLALEEATRLLTEHRLELERVSQLLLQRETLETADLEALLAASPGDASPAIAASRPLRV